MTTTHRPLETILLPVETAARELDAKLLLALFAAEAGFTCHIGVMSRIQRPGFPPSIYVSKSVRFAKAVRQMAAFGHAIVAWDEEGLVRFRDDIHNARIEPDAFRLPSMLLSWGPSNSRVWRGHPFYDGTPIVDSGNPRIDLLRDELRPLYEPIAAELRRRHGRFALLNTNFSFVNHYKAGGRPPKVGKASLDGAAYIAFKREVDSHKQRLFTAFQAALPAMARSVAPHKLIVRPHPSEDKASWRRVAEPLANVEVIYEGPVVQWLLAARCLIHNGCTSAVEASVLRLPVLAYRPVIDPAYDFSLPNDLSENFTDADALGARARTLLETDVANGGIGPYSNILRDNLSALDGAFASQRIVSALDDLRAHGTSKQVSSLMRLAAHGRRAWRSIKHRLKPEEALYEKHKSDVDAFMAEAIAVRARAMGKVLGRFENLRFAQRAEGIVTISAGN